MPHGKNNDDNNIQLISSIVENLNEVLSTENASIDRIISRINQTPLQEVKQRLKQHLEETYIQKQRLNRIIIELGGKPTDAKAGFIKIKPTYGDNEEKFSKGCRIEYRK